jgi:hypothetical protein
MITNIEQDGPAGLLRNYYYRVYSNPSPARGHMDGMSYAKSLGFDSPRFEPILTPVLERLRASGNTYAANLFKNMHDAELRAEREVEAAWCAQRGWVSDEKSKSYEDLMAANKSAFEADQLERAVNERIAQLSRERELQARAKLAADVRKELSRG